MVKKGDEKEKPPPDPEAEEKKRLRSLAVSRRLLRRGAPAKAAAPLDPSKAVTRLQGYDIVKRGQRKSRFLFSFPGLLAPLSAGRVGELANLASKNPVLYLEFPQGRMKLFGTHVYPKNKYLTLQLTKSSKGVVCEDVFESMIVFSEAWWIGTKEENPGELQLEFPRSLNEGNEKEECDFKGGAGAKTQELVGGNKPGNDYAEPISPHADLGNETPENSPHNAENSQKNVPEAASVRQSARTAGQTLSYAESSSEDDIITSNDDVSEERVKADSRSGDATMSCNFGKTEKLDQANVGVLASGIESVKRKRHSQEKVEEVSLPLESHEGNLSDGKPLVQATLSRLFKKVEKGSASSPKDSPRKKGPVGKRQKISPKKTGSQTQGINVKVSSTKKSQASRKKNGIGTPKKQKSQVSDDEVEEISSDTQDDSDEDWAA